jgi:hypothetical protein
MPELDAGTLADMVHDAVAKRRFWIVTHPDTLPHPRADQRLLAGDAAMASSWLAGHAR